MDKKTNFVSLRGSYLPEAIPSLAGRLLRRQEQASRNDTKIIIRSL
jgi:hypothetical protein